MVSHLVSYRIASVMQKLWRNAGVSLKNMNSRRMLQNVSLWNANTSEFFIIPEIIVEELDVFSLVTWTREGSKSFDFKSCILKVLTNEKREGLTVVSFDRSGFMLFSLWFSNKSIHAPSCERHKTAQQTLFLLFANNNCFPKLDEKLVALFEFRSFLHHRCFK